MSENTSKVYFTDFRCKVDEGPAHKLSRLIDKAGLGEIDMDGKFVAIKMHFGELGNMSYLRPNYAKAIVDYVKARGGKPFLTDCNTMYPGFRKNAIEHLYCAWENGFTPLTVGCPVIIGDGLKGTDDIAVPVVGGEYVKEALASAMRSWTPTFSFRWRISKATSSPALAARSRTSAWAAVPAPASRSSTATARRRSIRKKCRGCKRCLRECANNGLQFDEATKKMTVTENCVGCGRCLGACNFDAIDFARRGAKVRISTAAWQKYAKAVVYGRPSFHVNIVVDVSPNCDCHSGNDAPMLPDIGMFASFDPLAVDQACADACLAQEPLPNTQLTEQMEKDDFCDHHDHFENVTPNAEYKTCLEHAEKIGLGSRKYELITVK